MRINYKFHAIAVSVISAVIVVIFVFFGPKTPDNAEPVKLTPADSYVRIVTATWGENCNVFIEAAIAQQAQKGLAKDEHGNVIPSPTLKKVAPDNVLAPIKGLCDGKVRCQTRINSQTLGSDPFADCFKRLAVAYRCFEVDRLHTASINQGDNLTIDCSNPKASNAASSGQ